MLPKSRHVSASMTRAQLAAHPALKWAAGIYAKHRGKSAALAKETVI
jgi:hypothetical protein